MDGRRWVSPRGCASGVDGPNKHYGRRATSDRTCVYSRIGSGAGVENKALVVLAGGRRPQRFMADRMGAKVRSHHVDHTPMYAEPNLVIEVMLQAARETLSGKDSQ
jgi:hypothetical protein